MAVFRVTRFLFVYPYRDLYLGLVEEKEVFLNTNYVTWKTDIYKIVACHMSYLLAYFL
jgi:hypothetical protein